MFVLQLLVMARILHQMYNFLRFIQNSKISVCRSWDWCIVHRAGGCTPMARGGIRLVHGLTKSTLITYFSGMKIDLKYAFLHAFFLICLLCPFPNLSIWPKTHPFFQFCTFLHPLNDVCAYIAWSWKTTLITWIFGQAWYPPWHSSSHPWTVLRIEKSMHSWTQ